MSGPLLDPGVTFDGPLGICHLCARRTTTWSCEAFPAGIPLVILKGEVDHRQPFPGDNGLTFKAKPAA